MKRYGAVTVLYNPDSSVKDNICTYIDALEIVFVIDNSEEKNWEIIDWCKSNCKIEYISLNGNEGLGKALSLGISKAIMMGMDYVMTMDQDSFFANNAVQILKKYIEISNLMNVGIICPTANLIFGEDGNYYIVENYFKNRKDVTKKDWVMTSGSMMNSVIYKNVGGIDESLFVDHIDIDLGIKMKKAGYEIHQLLDARIYQRLGNSKEKKFLWKTIHPMYTSPLRTYYVVRNQKYLLNKHGKEFKKFTNVSYLKILIKIILYEDSKLEHFKMFYKGYQDGRRGKMGKIS